MTSKTAFLVNGDRGVLIRESIADMAPRIKKIERDLLRAETGASPGSNPEDTQGSYHMSVHLASTRLAYGTPDHDTTIRQVFIRSATDEQPYPAIVFKTKVNAEGQRDMDLIRLIGDTPHSESHLKKSTDDGVVNLSVITVAVRDMASLIYEIADDILEEYPMKTLNQNTLERDLTLTQ